MLEDWYEIKFLSFLIFCLFNLELYFIYICCAIEAILFLLILIIKILKSYEFLNIYKKVKRKIIILMLPIINNFKSWNEYSFKK